MARERVFARRSRRLAWLLLAVTVPPAMTLVWLAVQLLGQDRALFAQRDLERRQAASDTVVRALQARLTGLDQLIETRPLPAGTIVFNSRRASSNRLTQVCVAAHGACSSCRTALG